MNNESPPPSPREARLAEVNALAESIGLNPKVLELTNDQNKLKDASRLKALVGNAEVYVGNLTEQAAIALSEIDAKASTTRASVYQSQAVAVTDIVAFLEDPNPGVDAAKLAKIQASLETFKEKKGIADNVSQQVEAIRYDMYSQAISAATAPELAARGYSPVEIKTFSEATTRQLMGIMADLKTDQGMANDLAAKMARNLQTNTTQMSVLDINASKIHNAMSQAFNNSLLAELDGEQRFKPALEGSAYGRFSASEANKNIEAAALQNNVVLAPAVMVHQQFQDASIPHVGTDMIKSAVPAGIQLVQASDTFKVSTNQVLDESGATVAFGKNQIGSRVERFKAAGLNESQVDKAAFQDSQLIGTVAPLYGTSDQVNFAMGNGSMQSDARAKLKALNGDATSLITRSVASSAVDKALGMNSLATEKFGLDESGKGVGLSVGVAGAPILQVSDDRNVLPAYLDIDYSDPAIQKGLSDLQVQDYITGQIDRHTGNIFVDPGTKEVRGIDNDLAFPVVDRETMIQKDTTVQGKAVAGMPALIHVDTADKIEALSPAELRKTLETLQPPRGIAPLEPAAIDGAVKRLEELQEHVKELRSGGKLVTQFNEDTFRQATQMQQGVAVPTSYVGTAIIENANTERLNLSSNANSHRTLVKAEDVHSPRPDDAFAAYKAEVQKTRDKFLENPKDIEDPAVSAAVIEAQGKVSAAQKQLAENTQDLKAVEMRLQNAVASQNVALIGPLKDAARGASETRQENLQTLKAARQELDSAINQALEPHKPELAQKAMVETLESYRKQEPLLQEQVTQTSARVEAAQKAESAAWDKVLEVGGDHTEEVTTATQELQAAKAAHQAATEDLAHVQKQLPYLEERVVANQLSLEMQQHLQAPRVAQPPLDVGQPQVQVEDMDVNGAQVEQEALDPVALEPGPDDAAFQAKVDKLMEKRAKLEHPDAADRIKAFLQHGPKGTEAAIAKIDKEIAAVNLARSQAQSGVSIDQQKQDLDSMKTRLQENKQGLKDLRESEKILTNIERKADLDGTLKETSLGGNMSTSERDSLVKEMNKAINVREALKPQEETMKKDVKELGADVKQGGKALQVRQALGNPGPAAPAAANSKGHSV